MLFFFNIESLIYILHFKYGCDMFNWNLESYFYDLIECCLQTALRTKLIQKQNNYVTQNRPAGKEKRKPSFL